MTKVGLWGCEQEILPLEQGLAGEASDLFADGVAQANDFVPIGGIRCRGVRNDRR